MVCYGIFWSGQFPDQRVASLVADLQSSVCFVLVYFFFIDAPLNEVNIMGYKTAGRPVTVIS